MIAASETMKKKRKIKDSVLNIITYLSSALSVFVLLAIFVFIFSKGSGTLGLKMLTGNYWSSNYMLSVEEAYNKPGNFERPSDLDENVFFSSKWGIGFVDAKDTNKDDIILVEYIDENSPFLKMIDESVKTKDKRQVEVGYQVENLPYTDANGVGGIGGAIMSQSAKDLADTLDR